MAFVFKIKFDGTLRRVNLSRREDSGPDLTFSGLETKIRHMFQISPNVGLVITYTDKDNDVVTMGDDQDLQDSCVIQNLNPLRLDVKVADAKGSAQANAVTDHELTPSIDSLSATRATELPKSAGEPNSAGEVCAQQDLKGALSGVTTDAVQQLLAAVPRGVLSEAVESLLKVARGAVPASLTTTSSAARRKDDAHPTSVQSGPSTHESFARIFHKGVQCDGCGMTPIVGPRFKSSKKEDYDLCFSCYTEIGNETDYQRIDRPIHSRRNHYYHPSSGARMMRHPMGPPPPPFKPFFSRGPYGWKPDYPVRSSASVNVNVAGEHIGGKLDARFVQDVTIFDGTELAPGTGFTKIWRLRNIGTLPWPQLTQLIHVGGDVLGSDKPVNLELPEQGLPCDEEIDASVDLVAPERPGRYVSHWRLMAPSGQKFGHRVWVLIQVLLKDEESPQVQESLLPDQQTVGEEHKALDRVISVTDGISNDSSRAVEEPMLHEVSTEGSLNETARASSPTPKSPAEVSVPTEQQGEMVLESPNVVRSELGGFSLVEKPAENAGDLSNQNLKGKASILEKQSAEKSASVLEKSGSVNIDVSVQEVTLLETLNSMGFTHRTLNLELLRKNENDLQGTIDDLVVAAGWDHMLDDLEEMGFYDAEMNRCLLFKNNGSVKRVVKELLEMQSSSGKKKENSQ